MRTIIEMLRVYACAKGFEATRDTQVALVGWNFSSQLTNEKSGLVSSMLSIRWTLGILRVFQINFESD